MRVGIATVHTPGVRGGAELLVDGLVEAVRNAGHLVQKITAPFFFEPPTASLRTMDQCLASDYLKYDGGQVDRLICLKFPAYFIPHPDKRVWLLHQHRAAYELYNTPFGWPKGQPETEDLRARIEIQDRLSLSGEISGSARAVYTIAERVSERLRTFSNIESKALYHPPADVEKFRCEEALPYIFVPSRLERLKRQELLLRALAECRLPVQAVFAGSGGLRSELQELAGKLGVSGRVCFLGNVTRSELLNLYAHAMAVFFGPLDEDYGYVTLEAMLSAKAVITCADSGGPLEFVINGETGFVAEPTPQSIADAIQKLMNEPSKARKMGANGKARYEQMEINWSRVVETLLQEIPVRFTAEAGRSA